MTNTGFANIDEIFNAYFLAELPLVDHVIGGPDRWGRYLVVG